MTVPSPPPPPPLTRQGRLLDKKGVVRGGGGVRSAVTCSRQWSKENIIRDLQIMRNKISSSDIHHKQKRGPRGGRSYWGNLSPYISAQEILTTQSKVKAVGGGGGIREQINISLTLELCARARAYVDACQPPSVNCTDEEATTSFLVFTKSKQALLSWLLLECPHLGLHALLHLRPARADISAPLLSCIAWLVQCLLMKACG